MGRKVLVLLVAGVLFWGLPAATALDAAEPYKVGAIFAITGPASWLGEPERDTVNMIAEEINAAGGINGHPLELVIEDTEGDETKTVLAVKKLIKKDGVLAIIGPSRSGTSMAVIPTIEKEEVPLISCAAAASIVQPVAERKWVFKTPQSDTHAAERILDHMKQKGITKVAIITISNGFGDGGRQELLAAAPKYGIEIVADERYAPADSDMTAQLTKIKGTDAQALINWSIGPPQVIVTKNVRQLGITIPFYQSHGWGSTMNIEQAGKAAEGVLSPLGRLIVADRLPDDNPQKAVLVKYKNDYETKFGKEVSTFGGHAYDALHLIIEALKEVGPDRNGIRNYLENRKNFIGTGGVFNFSPTDHYGLTKDAFEMIQVKNGRFDLAD